MRYCLNASGVCSKLECVLSASHRPYYKTGIHSLQGSGEFHCLTYSENSLQEKTVEMQLTQFCRGKAAGNSEFALLRPDQQRKPQETRIIFPPLWSFGIDQHLPDAIGKPLWRRNLIYSTAVIAGFLVLIKLVSTLQCTSAAREWVGEAVSIDSTVAGLSEDLPTDRTCAWKCILIYCPWFFHSSILICTRCLDYIKYSKFHKTGAIEFVSNF